MIQKAQIRTPAENTYRTKKMVILALMAAMAYTVVLLFRIPIIPSVPFLDLELKSAVILISSFIFGPLSGFIMTAVVCVIEMFTFSATGIIGCIMNILATASFVCPAAYLYKKRRTMTGAVAGLLCGTALLTLVMILWNYIATPLYMGVPRDAIAALMPAIIAFNLIKAGINSAFALLLYKFVVTALRKTNLIPENPDAGNIKSKNTLGILILSAFILTSCILIVLALNGIF